MSALASIQSNHDFHDTLLGTEQAILRFPPGRFRAGPKSPTHAELLRVIAGDNGHVSESELNSELGRAMALMNGQCASKNGPSSEMVLANSLWTRGMTLKKAYATASEAINGAKDINDWVEGATRGMIKDLIQTEKHSEHTALGNVHNCCDLGHGLEPAWLTQQGEFTTHSGQPKMVPMMHQLFDGPAKTLKGVRKEGLYDAISLPYKGDVFSAVALLPAVGVDMATAFEDWARGPQEFQPIRRVKIVMPKFKVSSQLSLKPVLKEMGVEVAFTVAADFTRMADGGLFISDVVHKAVVEVDEEGTVAAAATAVMMLRCVPAPPEEIIFNRPFAFMIYHNPTNLPAFVGVVHDPVAA
ncbi:hypothetical protein VOLCADRAFT_104321 [Volvox carteri f. nagariensis]|uniref:Serpin domain-containing protein n=1 Tax=Volvox carteri f. nagariensis TaxID=3068 RepID=D8TSW3_VOLCA|nr:uncharacterized protein VOLCADRAFT_104321 [Volvox carteri f. nagariensis]EFJ49447.1 hypothetical protein VOLCADRAFT_104321 [Volvox carteri f. nagariensis]|eukprot:XP_002949428.1 hypothetical protein VOLCADRAFT_104321 [Volvox carteri f. nagariensis]